MLSASYIGAFKWQGGVCAAMGAPFSGQILQEIASSRAVGEALGPHLAASADLSVRQLIFGAFPLRVLAGLHYLVIKQAAPDLARKYTTQDGSRLDETLAAAIGEHGVVLARYLLSPPQTNEVRRSYCLVGGFLVVANRTALPLRCFELGASAGLNTIWDRYGYEFNHQLRWGSPSSPLQLAGGWEGGVPPLAPVSIVERGACDLNPLDVADEEDVARMLSYVWTDQPDRLTRMRAAVVLARDAGVKVQQADALDWARPRFQPRLGTATILYHSIVWQYLKASEQQALQAMIQAAGALATLDQPLAWLRMEPTSQTGADTEVRLTLWPPGSEDRLAIAHSHGAAVKWL